MGIDRRQLMKILSASGAIALGGGTAGLIGQGLGKQQYGQQCGPGQAPPGTLFGGKQKACGGGGDGGGGGGADWRPYTNWEETYGGSAVQEWDSNEIVNVLAPLLKDLQTYGTLTSSQIVQLGQSMVNHSAFHSGYDSNYHYGAWATTAAANIPPSTSVVEFTNATSAQAQALVSYVKTNYGADLSQYAPTWYDPPFGTSSPSAALQVISKNGFAADESKAGGGLVSGIHSAFCTAAPYAEYIGAVSAIIMWEILPAAAAFAFYAASVHFLDKQLC